MKYPTCLLPALLAAVLLAPAAAIADTGKDLSHEEVTEYFGGLESDAQRLIGEGDYAGFVAWVRDGVTEEAVFTLNGLAQMGEHRQEIDVPGLNKQVLLQLGQFAAEILSQMPRDLLTDYAIDIEVAKTEPVGPHSARARTRIVETGKLMMPDMTAPPQARAPGQAQQMPTPKAFEAVAECEHLVRRRDADSPLQLGMTMCRVDVKL
ncbi:MAG: hypothetical protein WD270_08260 [Acetobacterales bacterium]